MEFLDPAIHQPARLKIMAALCQLKPDERVDFSYLKDNLGLTDGNLGAHLSTLEGKATLRSRRPLWRAAQRPLSV